MEFNADTLKSYLQENGGFNSDGTLVNEWTWKREAAERMGKSEKSLERYAQKGQIKQMERDRKTYYRTADLLKIEESQNAAIMKPSIESPRAPHFDPHPVRQTATSTESALAVPNQFIKMFEMLADKIDAAKPSRSSLAELTGKRRIDADEFAETIGMQKAKVKAAIKDAEDNGTLNRYAGLRNKAVYNCDDLEVIAEQLQADDKPIVRKTPNFNKERKKAAKV